MVDMLSRIGANRSRIERQSRIAWFLSRINPFYSRIVAMLSRIGTNRSRISLIRSRIAESIPLPKKTTGKHSAFRLFSIEFICMLSILRIPSN